MKNKYLIRGFILMLCSLIFTCGMRGNSENAYELRVNVKTNILNASADEIDAVLVTRILKNDGTEVTLKESTGKISGKSGFEFSQDLDVTSPLLWSVDSPSLYIVISELFTVNGNKRSIIIDHTENSFGIRSISVSVERGFLLNGKPLLLKGGCMHHDNGPLGAAAFDRAEERRVELMKASGFNTIRCSHNPPSPAFLSACDRIGMLVMDEAFDVWKEQKNRDDYHLYFDKWWQKDMSGMILRDRNHPSVVMWSIGNEVPERGKPEGAALAKTLAEASIGWLEFAFRTSFYPWTHAYCGDIDICGWKRPQSYYRDALWRQDQISMFVKSPVVEILDSKGFRNPNARPQVKFEIEGPGRIIAVGSSDPLGNQSFTQPVRKAYQGRCQVIIRAGKSAGEIKLKASSDGLQSSEMKILTEKTGIPGLI